MYTPATDTAQQAYVLVARAVQLPQGAAWVIAMTVPVRTVCWDRSTAD
jgi:hypothetical protein